VHPRHGGLERVAEVEQRRGLLHVVLEPVPGAGAGGACGHGHVGLPEDGQHLALHPLHEPHGVGAPPHGHRPRLMINLQRALEVRQPLDERRAEGGRVAAEKPTSPATAARPEAASYPHAHAQLPVLMHGETLLFARLIRPRMYIYISMSTCSCD